MTTNATAQSNYFIFKPATDTPETGPEYPQVQKMKPGYNYKAANSVHALSKYYVDFPDFQPDLDYFIVQPRAKLSDLLSVAPVTGGFLISDRLKAVLETCNLPPHRYYLASVMHKKDLYSTYHWMHIISNHADQVDYPKSTFFIATNFFKIGDIELSSKEDYLQKLQKLKADNESTVTIKATEVCFNNNFDRTLDLFKIGNFNADCFISSSLRQKIIDAKITGVQITNTDLLCFE